MRTPKQTRRGWLEWLDQTLFCWHRNEMSYREDGVWSLRCPDCGRTTEGLDTKARYVGPKEAA
jgi:hypothetical protein